MDQKNNDKVTVIADNLANNINIQKRIPGKDIVIFGSPGATRSLAQHNLIDAYWLFMNPIILGKGKKLFDDKNDTTPLKLKSTEILPSDVICCYYEK
jgi:dihydrofolate reductase